MKKENERYQSLLQERYSQADDVHSKMGKLQKELIDLQASQVPLQFDKEKLASEKEALLKHNKCNRLVFELLVDDFASIVLPSFHIVHKPVLIPKV